MNKEKPKVRTYFGMIMTSMTVITLLLVAALSLFSWKSSSEVFLKVENRLLLQNETNCFDQISRLLEMEQYYITELVNSKEMRKFIEADPEKTGKEDDLRQMMQDMILLSQPSKDTAIGFIRVFLKDGRCVSSGGEELNLYKDYDDCDYAASRYYSGYKDGYIPFLWIDGVNVTLKGVSTDCLIGIQFLYEPISLERTGAVLICIPSLGVTNSIKGLSEGGMLVRNDGKVLFSTGGQFPESFPKVAEMIPLSRETVSGRIMFDDHSYCLKRLPGGVLWFLMDSESLLSEEQGFWTDYMKKVLSVAVVAVMATLLLSLILSRSITVSVEQLGQVSQKIESGDLTARFVPKRTDEVAILGQSFNRMLDRIETFYHNEEKNAAAKSDVELKLLRAQINPHLLYNTLNSVVWIIRQGDTKKAEALVLSMGSFFKLALSKGNDEISLSEEISMINYYLEIQNLGRGKSYQLISKVPKELEKVKIMKLCLQPLVENSVIHGFTDWRDDGIVIISAVTDADKQLIRICVEDNGIGILPEDLARLSEDMECFPPKKEHKHFGLYSVHVRIRNHYGSEYGVSMESEVGEFTKMTVRLPLRKEENPDD